MCVCVLSHPRPLVFCFSPNLPRQSPKAQLLRQSLRNRPSVDALKLRHLLEKQTGVRLKKPLPSTRSRASRRPMASAAGASLARSPVTQAAQATRAQPLSGRSAPGALAARHSPLRRKMSPRERLRPLVKRPDDETAAWADVASLHAQRAKAEASDAVRRRLAAQAAYRAELDRQAAVAHASRRAFHRDDRKIGFAMAADAAHAAQEHQHAVARKRQEAASVARRNLTAAQHRQHCRAAERVQSIRADDAALAVARAQEAAATKAKAAARVHAAQVKADALLLASRKAQAARSAAKREAQMQLARVASKTSTLIM